jgi:NifU-like protein involved in Fe-S cluster formation
MLDEVYTKALLDYASHIPHSGRLPSPSLSAELSTPICGSRIIVDLIVQDGVITDFAQEVQACALGRAAAAILGQNIIGCTVDEMFNLRDQVHMMLKDEGTAPQGRWADLSLLQVAAPFSSRHASVLLAFNAVCKALFDYKKQSFLV